MNVARTHTAVLAFVVFGCCTSYARIVQDWTYEELVQRSDLVVLASVESHTPVDFDFSKEEPWASWLQTKGFGKTLRDVLRAEVTTLTVEAVLKGEHNKPKVEVFHYSFTELPKEMEVAPYLLKQGLAPKPDRGQDSNKYLVFLKRRSDGRYLPVTGQVDSAFSVRHLQNRAWDRPRNRGKQ